MRIVYRLVSYSRKTERMIGAHDVPGRIVTKVKKVAGIPEDDDGCGDYPLDSRQTREIGKLLDVPIELDITEYFLEPYVYETDAGDPPRR